MGLEHIERSSNIDATIKILFKVDTMPEVNQGLLRGSKLTTEGALQLFMYSSSIDWQYHASRDHETGNRKVDDILGFVYLYFTNPKYIPDDDDLDTNSLELYQYIRARLEGESQSSLALTESHDRALDILK